MKYVLFILLLVLNAFGCKKTTDSPTPGPTNNNSDITATGLGKGQPGLVGTAALTAWDNLAATEKNKVKSWNTLFVHASVGGDLEDGAENNGFKFDFYDGNSLSDGLNGADWNSINNGNAISNGEPEKKITAFRREVLEQKAKLQIAIFKFGYADITDANLDAIKTAYKQMIDDIRAAGIRPLHITPPLVYIATKDDGNEAKMKLADWMKATFTQDVIFDLQACESKDGGCRLGSVLRICDDLRSTAGCPSKGQGVDAPEGQGHLCEKAATNISKAFLMSIYNTGK